jgi:hypothetical protein
MTLLLRLLSPVKRLAVTVAQSMNPPSHRASNRNGTKASAEQPTLSVQKAISS